MVYTKASRSKQALRSRKVLCPCCQNMVASQTRTNHLQLRTGAPHIKARAFAYWQGVGLDVEPYFPTEDEGGLPDESEPSGSGNEQAHTGTLLPAFA